MTKCIEIVLRALIAGAAAVPLRTRVRLGRFLGAIFSFIPTRDRRVAELQLKRFLGTQDPRSVTRAMYMNLGQVALEAINLAPLVRSDSSTVSFPHEEHALKFKDGLRPTVALTAHFGNWDLLAAYMAGRGYPLTVIGRHARGAFQPILVKLREAYGVQMIWRTSGSQGLRAVCRALENKRLVAALIDQDTRVGSIPVPFFGEQAQTPTGLIELGKRYQSRFLTAFLVRDGLFRSYALIEEIAEDLSPEEILRVFHERLENLIKAHPDQWVWLHKRWRTRPDRRRLSSKEYIEFLENA